ncbi:NTPase KAP family P-loop domain-containing protein 1-like [Branchiostoma floridae x Branchiostoma japonicum]
MPKNRVGWEREQSSPDEMSDDTQTRERGKTSADTTHTAGEQLSNNIEEDHRRNSLHLEVDNKSSGRLDGEGGDQSSTLPIEDETNNTAKLTTRCSDGTENFRGDKSSLEHTTTSEKTTTEGVQVIQESNHTKSDVFKSRKIEPIPFGQNDYFADGSTDSATMRCQVAYAGDVPPLLQRPNNFSGRPTKRTSKGSKKKRSSRSKIPDLPDVVHDGGSDKPEVEHQGDPLGYTIYAASIAEILTDERLEMPISVGIYGGRGIGKTCLLAKIKEETNNIIAEKKTRKAPPVEELTPFPFRLLTVVFLTFLFTLAATITTAVLHPTAWIALLLPTLLAYMCCLLVMLFARGSDLRRRSNPMHWILGIYLDLIDPPCIAPAYVPEPERYEVIWVDFNAWEFSGCKVLWAGIVTRLCDTVEAVIGARPTRFYRCIMRKVEMRLTRSLPRRAWLQIVVLLTLVVLLVTAVGVYLSVIGIDQLRDVTTTAAPSVLASLGGVLGLLAVVAAVTEAIHVVKNVIRSQKDKLDAEMRRPNFAEQLGFMSLVKWEVLVVTSLLRFLQCVTRRQYRVIIVIDDLDCCAADRVVGVLEALNILLSDEDANFVTVLAVDQKTVVNCLKTELPQTVPTESSGYEYLKRIVRFSVCLPEANVSGRQQLWQRAVRAKNSAPLQQKVVRRDPRSDLEVATFLDKVVQVLHHDQDNDEDNDIMPYVMGNARHITSLYHVLRMTVRVIKNRGMLGRVGPKQVASWVVLVGQWPWRMGWVVQFVEDGEQKSKIRNRARLSTITEGTPQAAETGGQAREGLSRKTKLHEVYGWVREEMARENNREGWRSFNSLDGDPELFELLLIESGFTVQDMLNLLPCTINFNYCIKQTIAAARGLSLE